MRCLYCDKRCTSRHKCSLAPKPAPIPKAQLTMVDRAVDALYACQVTKYRHTVHEVLAMLEAFACAGLALVPVSDVPSTEDLQEAYTAGFRTAHENATGSDTNYIFGFERWLTDRRAAKDSK